MRRRRGTCTGCIASIRSCIREGTQLRDGQNAKSGIFEANWTGLMLGDLNAHGKGILRYQQPMDMLMKETKRLEKRFERTESTQKNPLL